MKKYVSKHKKKDNEQEGEEHSSKVYAGATAMPPMNLFSDGEGGYPFPGFGFGKKYDPETLLAAKGSDAVCKVPSKDQDAKAKEDKDAKTTKKRVVIDPGHGGDDPGTTKRSGKRNEADVTLIISEFVNQRLVLLNEQYLENVEVSRTRTENKNPGGKGQKASLNARVKFAKDNNADLFVSIHVDAASSETADKVSVYTKNKPNDVSKGLSANIATELTKVAKTKQGIVKKEDSHHVTREQKSETASTLVEVGYITNPEQEKLFNDDAYLKQLGDAIGDAIFKSAFPNATKKPLINPFYSWPKEINLAIPDALRIIAPKE